MKSENVICGLALTTVLLGGVGNAIAAPHYQSVSSLKGCGLVFAPEANSSWVVPCDLSAYKHGDESVTIPKGTTVEVVEVRTTGDRGLVLTVIYRDDYWFVYP